MTKTQDAIAQKLQPLGYQPQGYDAKGGLVMRHPEAGCLAINTHLRKRGRTDVLADAKRRLRFARSHHGKFLQYLYSRYDVQPGQTKVVPMNMRDALREYVDAQGIQCDSRQMHAMYENVRRNLTCLSRGASSSSWEISRPTEASVVKAVSAPLAPVPPKGTALPLVSSIAPTGTLGARVGASGDDLLARFFAKATITQLADRIELESKQIVEELRALAELLSND